ncbi:MAG: hypothetical protein ACPGSI_19020, partial [Pikeienuella sp.]
NQETDNKVYVKKSNSPTHDPSQLGRGRFGIGVVGLREDSLVEVRGGLLMGYCLKGLVSGTCPFPRWTTPGWVRTPGWVSLVTPVWR